MAFLRVINGSDGSESLYVVHDATSPTTIGRDPTATVSIDDERASRKHCKIVRANGAWFLQDLGSSNGTLLGKKPVEKARLDARSEIRIGNTTLIFHPDELPPTPQRDVFGTRLEETLREESGVLVYRSRQPAMDRDVRVDILSRSVPPAAGALDAVRAAIESASAPAARELTPVVYADLDDVDQPYVVLKLPPGEPLDRILGLVSSAPLADRIDLARAVTDALLCRAAVPALAVPVAASHVFVREIDGVQDATVPAVELSAIFTRFSGGHLHLPSYADWLAPECIRADAIPPADLATTAYAAAALAYRIIAGVPPMGRSEHRKTLAHHRSTTPAGLALLVDGVDDELSELIGAMLAKEPNQRPVSREEIARVFAGAIRSAEYRGSERAPAASRTGTSSGSARPAVKRPSRRPADATSAAASMPAHAPRVRVRRIGFLSGVLAFPIWVGIWVLVYYGARAAAAMVCEEFGLIDGP